MATLFGKKAMCVNFSFCACAQRYKRCACIAVFSVLCCLFAVQPAFAIYPTAAQTHHLAEPLGSLSDVPAVNNASPVSETSGEKNDAAWQAIQNGTFLQGGASAEGSAAASHQKLKRPYALMILVSASMPKALLYRYLKDAGRLGGRMVVRGGVGGDIPHTAAFVKDMGKATGQTVTIDPVVFEKLGVTRVPVIALFNQRSLMCLQNDACTLDAKDFLMLSGNISVHQALSEFASKGGETAAATDSESAGMVDAGLLKTAARLLHASDVMGEGA